MWRFAGCSAVSDIRTLEINGFGQHLAYRYAGGFWLLTKMKVEWAICWSRISAWCPKEQVFELLNKTFLNSYKGTFHDQSNNLRQSCRCRARHLDCGKKRECRRICLGEIPMDDGPKSACERNGQWLRRLLRPQECLRKQLPRATIYESNWIHHPSPAKSTVPRKTMGTPSVTTR